MSKQDLTAAITSLEESTYAICRQSENLRAQRRYLESVKQQRLGKAHASRSTRLAGQNLTLVVEENNQALTAQLEKLQEGVQSTISKVVSSATDYLQHDDRQLQDLVALSALDADDGKRSEAKVAELTEVLSDLTGEEIECRLNRIFLQRLAEKGAATIQEQSELQAQELEQDLKSLHIEIPYVAGMSASQDFKAPLLRALAEQQNAKHHQARNVLEDISNSMTILIEASEMCVNRLEAFQSYKETVSAFQAEFNALAQKFVTAVGAGKPFWSSQMGVVSPCMEDALKHWNVVIPESGSIEQALWAKKRKVNQDAHRSSATVEATLWAHLNRLPMNSERLLKTGTSVDADLLKFELDIQKLRDAVDGIDLAVIDQENGPQARFVERWTNSS